jgi:hypothetical protein
MKASRVQLIDLAVQRLDEQPHQRADFLAGAAPVLAAEGEQGQGFDTPFHALTDAHPHRLDASLVAGLAWQAARLSPAAVAIHDDRDVTRRRHATVRFRPA